MLGGVASAATIIFPPITFTVTLTFVIVLLTEEEAESVSVFTWAALSCVLGAPSSGLTLEFWRGLWLGASQPGGGLHLPAQWLWFPGTTRHSGRRRSNRTAAHRLWPDNMTPSQHQINIQLPPKYTLLFNGGQWAGINSLFNCWVSYFI